MALLQVQVQLPLAVQVRLRLLLAVQVQLPLQRQGLGDRAGQADLRSEATYDERVRSAVLHSDISFVRISDDRPR